MQGDDLSLGAVMKRRWLLWPWTMEETTAYRWSELVDVAGVA